MGREVGEPICDTPLVHVATFVPNFKLSMCDARTPDIKPLVPSRLASLSSNERNSFCPLGVPPGCLMGMIGSMAADRRCKTHSTVQDYTHADRDYSYAATRIDEKSSNARRDQIRHWNDEERNTPLSLLQL